jgi:hypothetical protein
MLVALVFAERCGILETKNGRQDRRRNRNAAGMPLGLQVGQDASESTDAPNEAATPVLSLHVFRQVRVTEQRVK